MPQLMPSEFLERMMLVHLPFGEGVVIGFVVDSENAYSYVTEENKEEWQVTTQVIQDTAMANLHRRSQGIEMTAVPRPNGLFLVNTMDGFDAVRILDEQLQELIAENIGLPFFAGIPNRDFLICWSKNEDRDFQDRMISQISEDFDEQPYPLSRSAFEIKEAGKIVQVQPSIDSRAQTADLN